MRRKVIKSIISSSVIIFMLTGCTATQQGAQDPNSGGLSKTQIGAIAGAILGATVGGVTDTKILPEVEEWLLELGPGAAIGAAIGIALNNRHKR